MPLLPCLECGRLSEKSRCRKHRTRQARGYDRLYEVTRAEAIYEHPWCSRCGHEAERETGRCFHRKCSHCPLTLDHIDPLSKVPGRQSTGWYQVLCQKCNRKKSNHRED